MKAIYFILLVMGISILALVFLNGNIHLGRFYHDVIEPACIWMLILSPPLCVLLGLIGSKLGSK